MSECTQDTKVIRAFPDSAFPTDFKSWSRTNLERIAREATAENRQLRTDLRAALDAYRKLLLTTQTPTP